MVTNIYNQEQYEDFYPYDKKYIKVYPQEYPCVGKIVEQEGGLMGPYKQVYVAYFPENTTPNESFIMGLQNPWILLE